MHYSPCRWPVKGQNMLESRWNVMAHGDAREGKWRGNRRMEWVAITLPTTSEHGVSSITNADAHNSAASSRLNWNPRRFKWTHPFRRRTKSGFCACAITFQLASTRTVRKVTPNNGSGPLPQKVGHAFLKKKLLGSFGLDLFGSWYGQTAGFCGHGTEPSVSPSPVNFLVYPSTLDLGVNVNRWQVDTPH